VHEVRLGVDGLGGVERVAQAVGAGGARHELRDALCARGERANGLKFDSAYSWAASTAAPTFQRCARG
jgi:hypothetical protein